MSFHSLLIVTSLIVLRCTYLSIGCLYLILHSVYSGLHLFEFHDAPVRL